MNVPEYVLRFQIIGGVDVEAMMSRRARLFVTERALAVCTRKRVLTDDYWESGDAPVLHVDAARRADVLLVMPATANILAKAAHGIADDLISATLLACPIPVVFAPAMNETMWQHGATQENARRAADIGYHVLSPGRGIEIADFVPGGSAVPAFDDVLRYLRELLASPEGGTS